MKLPFNPHILIVLLMTAFSSYCQAQDLVVGTLVAPTNSQLITNATVALYTQRDSTYLRQTASNEEGRFSIKNDTARTYLQIVAEGYDTLRIAVPATKYQGPTGLGKIEMGKLALAPAPPAPEPNCRTRFKQWWHRLFKNHK